MRERGDVGRTDPAAGIGLERLRRNRRRYWVIMGGLMLVGGIVGAVGGFSEGIGTFDTQGATAQWLAIGLVVVTVAAVAIGSWKYFTTVDELEVNANLWAGLIGINYYAVVYASWWFLAQSNVTPPIDADAVFITTMVVAAITFLIRRFR